MTAWITYNASGIYIGHYKDRYAVKYAGSSNVLDLMNSSEFINKLHSSGRYCAEVRFEIPPPSTTIYIRQNLLINLCGQTLKNYKFIIENGAKCSIRHGKLTGGSPVESIQIVKLNDGTCVLKDVKVDAYGKSDGKSTAYRSNGALLELSPDTSILTGKTAKQVRKMRQHLVIDKDSVISCKAGSMPAVYSQCLSCSNSLSAYIHRPQLDVYGKIYGKGNVPNDIILLAEYGNDKGKYQGSDTRVFDSAEISCGYGLAIGHINSGMLILHGGKIYGTSGVLSRYRSELSVPEDSTVEVHGEGNTGLTYLSSSIHSWNTGYSETSYSNSNHAWGLGHALMIDRQAYSFNNTEATVKVEGGKFISDHNLAIASYPYQNNKSLSAWRETKFVGPSVVIQSGKASIGADYNYATTEGADYDIMRPEHPDPVVPPAKPVISTAKTTRQEDSYVNVAGGILEITGENLDTVTRVELLKGDSSNWYTVPVSYSNNKLTSLEPMWYASNSMPTLGFVRVTTAGGKARLRVFYINEPTGTPPDSFIE